MRVTLLLLTVLSSVILQAQPSNRQLNNLETFARLYGYIRYFHPSDEASNLKWKQFAIYGSNKVLKARDNNDLLNVLNELFKPLAPSLLLYEKHHPLSFDLNTITPKDLTGYKKVFWYHHGLGLNANSAYNSVRLNRAGVELPINAFATVLKSIDGHNLRGKSIKLVGRLKANGNEGSGGSLWLRVDKKSGMGFFKNMQNNLITADSWNNYEITGEIDRDADNIVYGAFLAGSGSILIDKMELFIKDSVTNKWELLAQENDGFDKKNTEGLPESWQTPGSSDKSSKYDYDVKNIDGVSALEIKSAPNSRPIIESVNGTQPDFGTIITKSLNNEINASFPSVLYGTVTNTYPITNNDEYSRLKEEVNKFNANIETADSLSLRLGDVVISWNIFKHFFPYWEDANSQPDAILLTALKHCFIDKTPDDFKKTLLAMTAPLNDGHIWVALRSDTSNMFTLPVSLALIGKKVVVDKVFDNNIGNIKSGDAIEQINGKEAYSAVEENDAYLSGSIQWKNTNPLYLNNILSGSKNSIIKLSFNRAGNNFTEDFVRNKNKYELFQKEKEFRKKSGLLKDDIYYIDLDQLLIDSINAWNDKLATAKGVIFDLRGYPNSNHNVINHLLTKEEDTKWMFIPNITYPDYQNVQYEGMGWNMKPMLPHYSGKIIFLTDGRAISYAESFMGFIKDFKLATIVGQPTAGTNGNVNPLSLPGGYTISWTGMLVKNHDGTKHHLRGIVPDVYVERTIKGIAEGKDEFLDKAVEIIEADKN